MLFTLLNRVCRFAVHSCVGVVINMLHDSNCLQIFFVPIMLECMTYLSLSGVSADFIRPLYPYLRKFLDVPNNLQSVHLLVHSLGTTVSYNPKHS